MSGPRRRRPYHETIVGAIGAHAKTLVDLRTLGPEGSVSFMRSLGAITTLCEDMLAKTVVPKEHCAELLSAANRIATYLAEAGFKSKASEVAQAVSDLLEKGADGDEKGGRRQIW